MFCRFSGRLGIARALDSAHLALELDGPLDVLQHDGACASARDLDGAVVEEASPQVLLHEDALDFADDDLVGVAVNPAVAVEKALVAHEDGRCEVAHQSAQVQIGPLAESGLVDDGLAGGYDFADFHIAGLVIIPKKRFYLGKVTAYFVII